ncbi:putative subunit of benzoyl-CoA reductase/2-hydroxyglutaryl-CoA dehydratase [Methanosarcina barkeri 3]|uniref:Subunit of benzoyl-CoA reductase/2-hydroxyglutaryl-CoA dehydratase n=1 Tax=Methanosarcina barkeri 3 TaxID=1434107 RepID=A0A0E3SNS2_METBA|nr:2-hydroxyacyl-CoA dehydratase family protein [Methanosarcina barkeri]AKB82983.1 putative subunit of benzoyl-CoA reductase/2-hydroxyglutaryl-CoA dehydratase [Methanosarcina barkeri 3]
MEAGNIKKKTNIKEKIGITALVPPEIIYSCNKVPVDVNNFVTYSTLQPRNKLCAWCAIWREAIIKKEIDIDRLVVVAGGDCNNALIDGERVSFSGIPTGYFFYPFDGDSNYMKTQLESLCLFLGGLYDNSIFRRILQLKKKALEIDLMRLNDEISSSTCFEKLISCSDFQSDLNNFEKKLDETLQKNEKVEYTNRIAMLGLPPIYNDFHETAASFGLHIVYDELPYEFVRITGTSIEELAKNYSTYTFARNLKYRINFLKRELSKRDVDGIVHYTQFSCHHNLEDDIIRNVVDKPVLTIQGDMPSRTPEQVKLRLEAFSEMLKGEVH